MKFPTSNNPIIYFSIILIAGLLFVSIAINPSIPFGRFTTPTQVVEGKITYAYGNGQLLASQGSDNKINYYITDRLGSIRKVTDSSGNIVSSADYIAFGSVKSSEGSSRYKFTGKELDESGLYYYGARYYDSGIGRFVTADTARGVFVNPQSLNRYSYTLNNPLKYVDPTGNEEYKAKFKVAYVFGYDNPYLKTNRFDPESMTTVYGTPKDAQKIIKRLRKIEEGLNEPARVVGDFHDWLAEEMESKERGQWGVADFFDSGTIKFFLDKKTTFEDVVLGFYKHQESLVEFGESKDFPGKTLIKLKWDETLKPPKGPADPVLYALALHVGATPEQAGKLVLGYKELKEYGKVYSRHKVNILGLNIYYGRSQAGAQKPSPSLPESIRNDIETRNNR